MRKEDEGQQDEDKTKDKQQSTWVKRSHMEIWSNDGEKRGVDGQWCKSADVNVGSTSLQPMVQPLTKIKIKDSLWNHDKEKKKERWKACNTNSSSLWRK